MTFGSTFGRTFSPTFQPKSQAAASSADTWWDLNGTITSCVAAYQPKGAASYAASKTNLANPGTYDATDGAAYPTWDGTSGWIFNGTTQHLRTGINVGTNQTWSAIIRFSNVSGGGGRWLFGTLSSDNSAMFGIQPIDDQATPNVAYLNGSYIRVNPSLDSGVLAIAGNRGYRNGTAEGSNISTNTKTLLGNLPIGACITSAGLLQYRSGYIQAFAIYNSALTSTNIADLSTAMAAL
jgi:hypothetical protein